MSQQPLIVEGTWQEVAEIGARYADRRVRLLILPQENKSAFKNGEKNEPHLVDEGGVLVLTSLSVEVEDWDLLVEREREARMDSLEDFGKGIV